MYFIQAEFIACYNTKLFNEDILAWDFGPVVPSVYHEYARYGSATIFLNPKYCRKAYVDVSHQEIINAVIKETRTYTNTDLTKICHNQKPWKTARLRYGNVISPYELKEYFGKEENDG